MRKEKPLSEKEWMWRSKKWFPKEDVAHAVERLKIVLQNVSVFYEDEIDEIFGDLK